MYGLTEENWIKLLKDRWNNLTSRQNHCILVVKQELEKSKLEACNVAKGAISRQLEQFKHNLADLGFELLDDNKKKLIEKIKRTIINNGYITIQMVIVVTFPKYFLKICIKIIPI